MFEFFFYRPIIAVSFISIHVAYYTYTMLYVHIYIIITQIHNIHIHIGTERETAIYSTGHPYRHGIDFVFFLQICIDRCLSAYT